MPAAIDPIIKQRVIAQYLQGVSRDKIAADNGIGTGTVSNFIDEWKKRMQDSDYESIRELSVFCKKQGMTLNELASCMRLNNYIQSLGTNANESTLESLIANLAKCPDRDPAKLIEAAAQISELGIPLGKLEEHVKELMAEKETLQREIDEGRTTLDGVYEDVESRRKIMEEYAQMKAEMRRYGIGLEDPKQFSRLIQTLQRDNYDCAKILNAFAEIEDTKKLRREFDHDRQNLEARLEEVKDILPLAKQLLQYGVGINEVLAFMLVVDKKADMERISRGAAAFKVIEELREYSQLGGLKKEQERLQQQIFMSNMIMTTRQQAFVSLMRLQALGVTDMEIKNMAQLMDFNSILSLKEKNNGNTNNKQRLAVKVIPETKL
jgi:transcriptional regulator with XRE-family HTH domain